MLVTQQENSWQWELKMPGTILNLEYIIIPKRTMERRKLCHCFSTTTYIWVHVLYILRFFGCVCVERILFGWGSKSLGGKAMKNELQGCSQSRSYYTWHTVCLKVSLWCPLPCQKLARPQGLKLWCHTQSRSKVLHGLIETIHCVKEMFNLI